MNVHWRRRFREPLMLSTMRQRRKNICETALAITQVLPSNGSTTDALTIKQIEANIQLSGIFKNDRTSTQPIVWLTTFFMVVFHIGALAALFVFSWKAFLLAMVLWWAAGSLGIGMGYHRLLPHRGYKTPKWVEYFLTLCGTLALEGGPIFWVATHRIHHQHSDHEGDPHTPREGTYWAHMGWIMTGKAMH